MNFSTFIEKASFLKVIAALSILISYSYWAFAIDTSWSNAMAAADHLPEATPGFHSTLPKTALDTLLEAPNNIIDAYIKFQLIDIPYALLNAFFALAGIGFLVKILNIQSPTVKILFFLPIIYVGAEFIENFLLFHMASLRIASTDLPATIQQSATIVKFLTIAPAMILALLSIPTYISIKVAKAFKKLS